MCVSLVLLKCKLNRVSDYFRCKLVGQCRDGGGHISYSPWGSRWHASTEGFMMCASTKESRKEASAASMTEQWRLSSEDKCPLGGTEARFSSSLFYFSLDVVVFPQTHFFLAWFYTKSSHLSLPFQPHLHLRKVYLFVWLFISMAIPIVKFWKILNVHNDSSHALPLGHHSWNPLRFSLGLMLAQRETTSTLLQ